MKTTLLIARTELASIFFSPIAWLLLTVFTVQAFIALDDALNYIFLIKQMGPIRGLSLSQQILASLAGAMTAKVFLYIPLLTMGVIARESYSGSIKLLMSSPVRISQIVVGKYLALMVYFSLLTLILLAFVVVGGQGIENVEYMPALSGVLGMYLLMCTYVAIGLFMSCLTVHQVVAAISTFTVLGALQYIGSVGQGVPLLGDITYWLSLSGRTQKFLAGLITTKDILYFMLVTGMFLCFSVLKLSAGRKIETKVRKAGKYAFVMVVVVIGGYVMSRPALVGYLDVTHRQLNSLSETSLAIIAPVRDKKWKLTSYVNLHDRDFINYGLPSLRNREYSRFENYTRYLPNLEMDSIFYYGKTEYSLINQRYPGKSDEEIARRVAEQTGLDFDQVLSPEEMKKIVDLGGEGGRFVQHLEVDGKRTFLRMFMGVHEPMEPDISTAFKRVLQGSVKMAFVTGHRERSAIEQGRKNYMRSMTAKRYRDTMINQGFDIVTMGLDDPIGQDIDILVVADPREPFSRSQQKNLRDYIARGGDLLIAGDVGRQKIVNPLLKQLGVELMAGQLLQKTANHAGDLIQGLTTPEEQKISFYASRGAAPIVASRAVRLKHNPQFGGFTAVPFLTTAGPDVWNRQGPVDLETTELVFNPATDTKGTFTLALALSRKVLGKDQRILVLGDGDILSSGERGRSDPRSFNAIVFTPDIFRWLSHGIYPIEIQQSPPEDVNLLFTLSDLSRLRYVFYGPVPGLILFAGIALLYVRRRR